MPTVEVWVVLGEDGNYEVATDEDTALERGDDLAGTVCRAAKLNVTIAEPRCRDDDAEADTSYECSPRAQGKE
jgi:hypothetical protein